MKELHSASLKRSIQYRIGIDVGLHSIGCAAIEVDGKGKPISILNMESIIHDGGIDPTANKTAGTRKAVSGAARRMRRLYRNRQRRLSDLDRTLEGLGWPVGNLDEMTDPWLPWNARAELTRTVINDQDRLHELLSISLRHMARHRGWRNPYRSIESLIQQSEPSTEFSTLTESVAKKLNRNPDELRQLTVAEIVRSARDSGITERVEEGENRKTGEIIRTVFVDVSTTLRGPGKVGKDGNRRSGLLASGVHQSDNVRELRKIWQHQKLPDGLFDLLVRKVFQAKSPKGSAKERVARDDLDPTQKRAEKASLAFQRFRIVSILANLRIQEPDSKRLLTPSERRLALDYLWQPVDEDGRPIQDASWSDVAALFGVNRHMLEGWARETIDGERPSARPPVCVTHARILASGVKELISEWSIADDEYREALIEILGNGSGSGAPHDMINRAEEFIAGLPETVLAKFDGIRLPEGRAAYSVKTLLKLTDRMLATEDDLHAARKFIFGVSDDWRPVPEPIGAPVGNPAVDRVLKAVNRYLLACERQWGVPESVNVEHTRDGLISEKRAREMDRDMNARFLRNREIEGEIASYLNANSEVVRSGGDDSFDENPDTPVTGQAIGRSKRDIDRLRAFTRQNGKCLYCGDPLPFPVFALDHIVPRAGGGATNSQVNLAAVCRVCNQSKTNLPFAVWAASGARPAVSLEAVMETVDGFQFFGVESRDRQYQSRFKREVKARLKRTDNDEEIDSRSIESVGWMANELHRRISEHFAKRNEGTERVTKVNVYRGWITAEARKAAGIDNDDKRIMLIGGIPGKNRLDRRHHAIDAATIAMIRQGAAQSLTVQEQVRRGIVAAGSSEQSERQEVWDLAHVLAVRDNKRRTNLIDPGSEMHWKDYKGGNAKLFDAWKEDMKSLADLIQKHLAADEVPVFEFLRLKPGSSSVHEDKIRKITKVRLGDALPVELIDHSATPQQWIALTRQPDFDHQQGLPADPSRRIRIKNQWYEADDRIEFFPTGAGCVAVRGGYAELGSSFHHARIYRCTKWLKSGATRTFYAMMRVYQIDVMPFRNTKEDLFTVDLPPQCMSRRAAEGRLREALDAGDAEYIGWIVQGDELLLDVSSQTSGAIGTFLNQFPDTTHWVVQGLADLSKIALRPRYLSGEGAVVEGASVSDQETRVVIPASSDEILNGHGIRPSVDVLFGKCQPVVIRRDILGRIRTRSDGHLPSSWSATPMKTNTVGDGIAG